MGRSTLPVGDWRAQFQPRQRKRQLLGAVMASLHADLRESGKPKREIISRIRENGTLWAAFHDIWADDPDLIQYVEAFCRMLEQAGRAPKTILTLVSLLSIVMNHAVRMGAVDSNPLKNVRKEWLPKNEPRDPTKRELEVLAEDQARLVVFAYELVLRPVWATLLLTGTRIGELAGLSWYDFNPHSTPLGELVIAKSYDGHTRTMGPTKTGRIRRVPVHPLVADAILQQRNWYRVQVGRLPYNWEPIFPADKLKNGRPVRWSRQTALRRWRRDLEQLELPDPAAGPRTLHSTRYTFASALYRAGAPWRTIQTLTHQLPKQAADGCALPTYVAVQWADLCDVILRIPYGKPRNAVRGNPRA